jgi:hypothetical protein
MSSSKVLAEAALSCLTRLRDFPMHEKFAVLGLMNVHLTSEAKSTELGMANTNPLNAQAQSAKPPEDEHYQQ